MSKRKKPTKIKGVVVLSGGLDSTTTLYYAKQDMDEVYAISFDYGQRHNKELLAAKATCKKLKIQHKVINIKDIKRVLKGSALTDNISVPEGHYEDENMKQTVVPSRNLIFASIASAYAISVGARYLYLGVHGGDHAIYPDCRPEFIEALNIILKIANYTQVVVRAPFITSSKADIVKEGIELGVDFKLTWTCYKGKEKACGKCGSCRERLEAFNINKRMDPLVYEV